MPDFEQALDAAIDRDMERTLANLGRLVGQPSVSAQHLGIEECAGLVAGLLHEYGFEAEVVPSAGNPVVLGRGGDPAARTMLLYLHYDVQPPEPLALWDSDPFTLTRRDDTFYGRGVSDDKGHIMARLAAVAALRQAMGELPCQIKWIIEGEEEIGSMHMPAFVAQYQERLAADACIWEFGGVDYEGAPSLTLGMRGICYVQLSVRTANQDAHSGLGGSLFPNAAWRLAWALSTLKGQDERILIPGHYDSVVPPSATDLALLAALPDTADRLREHYGLARFLNDMREGLEFRRAAVFEPTCTICGLTAGYQGPGSKTVLPAEASAKVDFRLVPNQTPEEVLHNLRAHLDAQGFPDVEIAYLGGGRPAKVDPEHPFVQLTRDTGEAVYGKKMVIEPMIGGSGPLYPFVERLKVPVVSAGIAYPGSQVHAPNENMKLGHFRNGIRHTARIIEAFARS